MRSPIGHCNGGGDVLLLGVLSRGERQTTRDTVNALAASDSQPPVNGSSRHCGCFSSMPSTRTSGCVASPRHCSD